MIRNLVFRLKGGIFSKQKRETIGELIDFVLYCEKKDPEVFIQFIDLKIL